MYKNIILPEKIDGNNISKDLYMLIFNVLLAQLYSKINKDLR